MLMYNNFYELNLADFQNLTKLLQLPVYRAKQLMLWQKKGIFSFDEMTDIGQSVREQLKEYFSQCGLGIAESLKVSCDTADGTQKFLFTLYDAEKIESVCMLYKFGASVCVSSEAGCRMGCKFCASASTSYGRPLSAGEMFAQVAHVGNICQMPISHVTIMGTGEPLENLTQILQFMHRLHDPIYGFNLSYRKMSLSTCGIPDKIREFAAAGLPATLCISLHAPNQKLRASLMPIAQKYDLQQVLAAADFWTSKVGRRVTYEYVMLRNVNDSSRDALELCELLHGRLCHVNLIPYNPVPGSGFASSPEAAVKNFANILDNKNINVTVRRSMGRDVDASCGQLRRRTEESKA